MLTFIAAAATTSGLVASLLPAIQIAKMRRLRSSAGISLPYLVGGLANNIVWVVYACAMGSVPLMASTVSGLAMNVTIVSVAVVYRPRATIHLVPDAELASDATELARAA